MKIPRQIRGFGFIYPVIQRKNHKWLGTINHRKGFIILDKSAHHNRKESSLIHELIHFVNAQYILKLNEHKVDLLETGLYTLLKENKLLR